MTAKTHFSHHLVPGECSLPLHPLEDDWIGVALMAIPTQTGLAEHFLQVDNWPELEAGGTEPTRHTQWAGVLQRWAQMPAPTSSHREQAPVLYTSRE